MTRFLETLSKEVEAVKLDGHAGADTPADERDHVVGVLPDDLKALFVIREAAAKAVDEIKVALLHTMVDAAAARDKAWLDAKLKEIRRPFSEAMGRWAVLENLFWACVRNEFLELADKSSIGVRNGWDVVWTDEEAEPSDPLAGFAEAFGHAHLVEIAVPRRPRRRSRIKS